MVQSLDTIKVYVIHSPKFDRKYVGMTVNVEARLAEHNSGKTRSTKPYIPWEVVHSESYPNREEARKREKYLKSAAGRRFLKTKLGLDN